MEARSISRHLRIAPQKARLVVDVIRGKNVGEALSLLEFMPKKGARMVIKTLKSAVANAEHTQRVDVDRLYVKHVSVGAGATLKRFTPRAQGRATPIRKRTSHVTIVVDERA
ncbi:MAG TPA: 50S ribosomal protein L22 [Candidatus Kryptonia bacterium]|nr:50S ribosomal protein L22 [Candidatus Kryptonia bacterium]